VTVVGLLHPGAMGSSIGAACRGDVIWVPAARSSETAARAATAGLRAVASLAELVGRSDIVVSVCPPAVAAHVAGEVAEAGFAGVYVDANAIAPATTRRIAEMFDRFVDGGIVGPPAEVAGTTRLFLSGPEAADVARLWHGSVVEAVVVDGGAGAASALKMAYATWTKVSAALLLGVRALARSEGVEAALLDEWARSQPGVAERSQATARGVAPKAWRFAGEMREIAATFDDADLPDGFGLAAADLYERLVAFKDRRDVELAEVLDELLGR
jgi:3-hydroxyisobutyrate dehydrogenase-like beta-hydroxyacid dehydrogenase